MNSYNVKWKSEYNISNFIIDKEHQNLFIIAQKALLLLDDNNSKEELIKVKKLIFELSTYVGEHFTHEQDYMEEIKYPEINNQISLHKNMISILKSLITKFNSLEIIQIKEQLVQFINEYFLNHIILEDRKIKLFNIPLDDLRKSFGWKDIYCVNNEIIDKEHKKLFEIASRAFCVSIENDRRNKIKSIVLELYDYMKSHFQHEEGYMYSIEYPKTKEHIALHDNIIEMLNNYMKDISNIDSIMLEKEIARMIDIVFLHHIIQEDRKIINYVNTLS